MADNLLQLLFSADTKDLDKAHEKLTDLGGKIPTVGEAIESLAKSFASIPGPVGLAVAGVVGFGLGLKSMVESTIQAETQLLELSEAMGVPVEKAQPFIEAMALAGIEGTKLSSSMAKLAQAVGQAITEPTGKAADAFKKLGISQEELKNGDTEQIMKDAAKGLDQYADSATKTAVIRELFGKQGPAIVAAMRDEAEMEAKAAQAQEDYGTKVTEADAKSAKYFGETLKLGMSMFEGVSMSITKSLLPGLQVLVDQFAESGKQGGVMRDILDGLSATISFVAKVIITMLVEPVRFAIEVFKEAGTAIGGSMAAIAAAAHGNFSQAKQIIVDMNQDLIKMTQDYEAASAKFVGALWNGTSAVKDQGAAVDANKPKFEAYNAGAQKVTDTLEKLRTELAAQQTEEKAAAQGLEQYKAAQDEVAISTMKLSLLKEGATKAQIEQAVQLKKLFDEAKQGTAEEVAGWNLINRLQTENIGLTTHQTELQKNLAEIAKNSQMTDAQKVEATALANENEVLKEQEVLKKEINAMDAMVNKDSQQLIASMTLSTNELKLYNEQLKLKAQYEKDMVGKSVQEQAQLTTAYQRNLTLLKQNDQQTRDWASSMAGFGAGAHKAMTEAYEDATNLNKIGGELVTTFNNSVVSAFQNMGQNGQNAFKQVLVAMLQFFEGLLVKMVLTGIEQRMMGTTAATTSATMTAAAMAQVATMEAAEATPQEAWAIVSAPEIAANASAAAVKFADGGAFTNSIVTQPTMFNLGQMGEAGPEAIMPLRKTADGSLGIAATGGQSSTAGGNMTYHAPQIHIYSNQEPEQIAKQVRKTALLHDALTTKKIMKEKRSGGMLSGRGYATAR